MDPFAALIAISVAVVTATGAYLAAVKKLSGTIATSTADELWAESKAIRQEYARRIAELNELVSQQGARIDALEARNQELHLENGNLKRLLEEQGKTIDSLRHTVERLETDNTELRQENIRLRARVKELENDA